VLRDTTPLTTLGSNAFSNTHASLEIYVGASVVANYKAASGWSSYASRIRAGLVPFFDGIGTVEELIALYNTHNKGDTIYRGTTLQPNDFLLSQNGTYSAVMKANGDFVVYKDSEVLWAVGSKTGSYFTFQSDGNLVVYTSSNVAWSPNIYDKNGFLGIGSFHGPDKLIMQDDGNLVAYTNGGKAVWASNTCQTPSGTKPGGETTVKFYWWGFRFYISHNGLIDTDTFASDLSMALDGLGPQGAIAGMIISVANLAYSSLWGSYDHGNGVIINQAWIGPPTPFLVSSQ
jgi:hypothetical protein